MALLVRDRLSRKLSDASQRVTLLAAGAGFGKSVAIRHLRESSKVPVLHYEVRADSFVPFVRGFVDAAAHLAPGLQTSFAGAIELAMQSSKPHEEIALWVLDHLNAVKIGAIALDDLDRAAGDDRVGRFLVRVIAGAPTSLRWVLAVRERVAAERRLHEGGIVFSLIGEDELRLTQDEALLLAESSSLPQSQAARLYELTGGEPAAFHLGTYVFGEKDAPEGCLHEFYAGRYLDRCPADVRELLLGICVLDEVDDELLRRSPWASSAHQVPALTADGLLFSDRGGGRYRWYEPLRALLQQRLGGDEARGIARSAGARMLEERGLPASALELYLEAGDARNIQRLCEREGFDLADRGHLDVLRRALSRLGEVEMQKSAALLALKAMSESFAGRTDTAESWYLHALRLAEETPLRAAISHRYAIDLIRQGRTASVDLLEPFAEHDTLDAQLAASIHATLATAYVVASRFDDATAAMERALQYTAASDSVSLHATIQHQAAWVALFTGAIAQGKQHALRAVELALSCDAYDIAARAYSVLYNISCDLEDDARTALDLLNEIWACGLKAGDVRMRLFALIGSFDIAAELGDTDALARLQRTLEAHEVDYADPMISDTLLPAQALRVAASGDFVEAFRLLHPTAERQISDDRKALRFAEIALYAAAAGNAAEARAAIVQVLERLGHLDAGMRRTLRTNAILAVALYLVGRRSDAVARLRDVASAQQHASVRIRMLTKTLEILFARWDGAENFEALLDALHSLHASDFGGLAAVLAALPYTLPVSAA